MKLEKRLARWTSAGLLTEEQSNAILAWEHDQPSMSWVLFGITGLGVVVLMTGVVSIIAANWDDIPARVKLTGYFLSLVALAYGAWRRHELPGVVRECLLTVFALYVLAGIGLIGQVYHLTSNGYEELFLWLTLILPTTLLAKSRLVNNVWFLGLVTAMSIWVGYSDLIRPGPSRIYVATALPYLFLGLGYLLWDRFEFFASTARVWSYAVLLLGFGVAANVAWSLGEQLITTRTGWAAALPFTTLAIALGAVALRRPLIGRGISLAITATLVLSALLILPPLYLDIDKHEVLGCALFIAAWSGAAAIAAGMERRRLFDFAALVIAVRFVVVYFEVFGSLAATGIGLICSGAVILGFAYLWYRHRGTVARAIREGL